MKKAILLLAIIVFTVYNAIGQHRKTIKVEAFDEVQLDGNIRLYLEQHSEPIVEVDAKKDRYLDEYRIEVRNGTLYIKHRDKHFRSAAKIRVYLGHPELKGVDMDGLVYVYSKDPITGETFFIKGDGFIRGNVEVDVQELRVDLDGFCSMSFSGKADESDLRLDGLGGIDARELETSKIHKSSDGLTRIRVAKLR